MLNGEMSYLVALVLFKMMHTRLLHAIMLIVIDIFSPHSTRFENAGEN